ncbi:gamma-secretase subunit Aph-1b-like isoform X2 [Gopherus evgoodei]|uniref:gamma-secretase subunit Aph-1b-like isoform X2 n=1 Tax=Gopherus evgoodei TaxID=1825980 RepID=UPI0011CFE9C2|nr:gamma-secretase subunit Aph-1b-like isoform X2 [Gopherus evgoodei]
MTLAVFFGCSFIAFGPALGLCLFSVVREPLRVIILVAGAFFWLVSLLLSSLVWFIAVKASDPGDEPLQKGLLIFGVLFSVLLQEAFRFLYYKLLRKAIEGLVALSEDGCSPISIQQMAYAGLGFGLMSGAFSMINLLADALGPGTVGIHGDSQLYFLTSAFMTMVMIFLHTFWGILFFHGCETQRWWEMVAVIFTHLIVSGLGSRVRQAPSQDPEGPSGALSLSCSLPALPALWCCQLGPTVAFSAISFLFSVIGGPPFVPAGGRCPGAPAARE